MSRIVHVQTTIQAVFGVLDDDGNVQPQQPVVMQVYRFTGDAFAEAQRQIAAERDRIAAATPGL